MTNEEKALRGIVEGLVEFPADIKVERSTDDQGVLLTLSVNQADMGKVIGREGETARAIRTVMRAIGRRNEAAVSIKIAEPAGSTRPQWKREPYVPVEEGLSKIRL